MQQLRLPSQGFSGSSSFSLNHITIHKQLFPVFHDERLLRFPRRKVFALRACDEQNKQEKHRADGFPMLNDDGNDGKYQKKKIFLECFCCRKMDDFPETTAGFNTAIEFRMVEIGDVGEHRQQACNGNAGESCSPFMKHQKSQYQFCHTQENTDGRAVTIKHVHT